MRLIEMSIKKTLVKLKVGGAETEPIIRVKSELRQRNLISPILFNQFLEKVVIEIDIQSLERYKPQESSVAVLAYADDVIL